MTKNKEYRAIQEIKNHEKRQGNCYVLVGDFNARILKGDGLRANNFGKYFLKTEKEISEINQEVWNNRERFVEFIHGNELVVKNTMFNKSPKNKCTYKNKKTGHKGGKPWNTTNYGQVDYILSENKWKNAIYETWSSPYTNINSDHFPVMGRMKIKFATKEKIGTQKNKPIKIDH